jgi:hypothetical protein
MARKPTMPSAGQLASKPPMSHAAKQMRIGEVEAADERDAGEKAAKEFGQHPLKLVAVPRR